MLIDVANQPNVPAAAKRQPSAALATRRVVPRVTQIQLQWDNDCPAAWAVDGHNLLPFHCDFKFFHEFKAWEPNVVRPGCREAAALRGASHAKQPHKIFNLKFSEMGHNVIQGTPAPGSTQAKCDSCQGFY